MPYGDNFDEIGELRGTLAYNGYKCSLLYSMLDGAILSLLLVYLAIPFLTNTYIAAGANKNM